MAGSNRKFILIALFGIAVVAVMVAAAGITGLELSPGAPFAWRSPRRLIPGARTFEIMFPDLGLLGLIVSLLFWPLLLISVVLFILSPETRRRVLRDAVYLSVLYLALMTVLRSWRQAGELGDALDEGAPLPEGAISGLSGFSVNPPDWLVMLVSFGLIGLVAALFWLGWRTARRQPDALEEIAREARQAIGELSAGADLKDAVLRCYSEMGRIIGERHGIHREQAMTPREFERRLVEAGLKVEHVRRLTRLFEDVRYGTRETGASEEREAVACLQAIAETAKGRA